jgi:hypothetical protein
MTLSNKFAFYNSDLVWFDPSDGFNSAISIMSKKIDKSLIPQDLNKETVREQAIRYYSGGPSPLSDSTLLARAWIYGVTFAVNQGGRDIFNISFPEVDSLVVPFNHVNISSPEEDST